MREHTIHTHTHIYIYIYIFASLPRRSPRKQRTKGKTGGGGGKLEKKPRRGEGGGGWSSKEREENPALVQWLASYAREGIAII